jgi:hypothetical protein
MQNRQQQMVINEQGMTTSFSNAWQTSDELTACVRTSGGQVDAKEFAKMNRISTIWW